MSIHAWLHFKAKLQIFHTNDPLNIPDRVEFAARKSQIAGLISWKDV